ncbi:hypothetical protein E3T19_05370 [Cryobacterium sp. TMT4-31]|nr:hypothetical protein E3T19_05370 [Cryobacterium sp. TMT4-31]
MAINSAHRWLAGSKRFAMIALLPAIILTVGCTAQAPELVGSSTVKAAFIDFVGSVEGVKSVRTRNWLSGFLEPGTMVIFHVTLGDESDSAEVDSTARLITEWVRTRVDPKADVTVYVTLFTAGNAVSLTADDTSNWARIQKPSSGPRVFASVDLPAPGNIVHKHRDLADATRLSTLIAFARSIGRVGAVDGIPS